MKQNSVLGILPLLAALSLLVPVAAAAQVVLSTVGPHGTFANIQDAIDASGLGVETEIRVEGGVPYNENLLVPISFNDGSITLTGGWDATFTARDDAPRNTVIDGGGGRVVDVLITGGSFEIDGFTITNGSAAEGAGMRVIPGGDAAVTIRNNIIEDNTASAAGNAAGGGLFANLEATVRLDVLDTRFRLNSAVSTAGGIVSGGGLVIAAGGNSRFTVEDCEIDENSIEGDASRSGAGIFLFALDTAQGDLLDSFALENTAAGTGTSVAGSGGLLGTSGSGILRVERTGWALNGVISGDSGPQLRISQLDESMLRISDSALAQGDERGIQANAGNTSVVHLINLSVADHPDAGVQLAQSGTATLALYNTISFGNGTDLTTSGTVDAGSNLIGVDPLFADPAGLDYRLRPGSPAENAGDNNPPGGLGTTDLEGNPRIKDGVVDIGSYEGIAEIFTDGFESGDTSAWSSSQ